MIVVVVDAALYPDSCTAHAYQSMCEKATLLASVRLLELVCICVCARLLCVAQLIGQQIGGCALHYH